VLVAIVEEVYSAACRCHRMGGALLTVPGCKCGMFLMTVKFSLLARLCGMYVVSAQTAGLVGHCFTMSCLCCALVPHNLGGLQGAAPAHG
jgi:hypothetical protein